MTRPIETDRRRSNNTFLLYEIYDSGRFTNTTVLALIMTGVLLTGSYIESKTPTELAVKCALSILGCALFMWAGLRAEDRAVKAARAGYRVFNAFRGTYSEGKDKDEPDLNDSRVARNPMT